MKSMLKLIILFKNPGDILKFKTQITLKNKGERC